jgi:sec-independent protein translocase protein TatB
MFGIGFGEFFLLALILFILIGPKQLPEVMKTIGKIARELSKARREFTSAIDQDESLRSIRESMGEVKDSVKLKVDEIALSIHKELLKSDVKAAEKSAETQKIKEASAPPEGEKKPDGQ